MLKWSCPKTLQEPAEAFALSSFTTIQQLHMLKGCLGVKTSGESSSAGWLKDDASGLFQLVLT